MSHVRTSEDCGGCGGDTLSTLRGNYIDAHHFSRYVITCIRSFYIVEIKSRLTSGVYFRKSVGSSLRLIMG